MKKKTNVFKKISWSFILLIFFSFILIGLIIWLIVAKCTTINPKSDLANLLYTYLGDATVNSCGGLPLYGDDVNVESLDESTKLCLSYNLLNKTQIKENTLVKDKKNRCKFASDKYFRGDEEGENCTISYIDYKDINKTYKNIFGENISEKIDFDISGIYNCFYDEKESRFVCGNSEIHDLQMGWAPTTYRMIKKIEKKDNKLYFYDYFISLNSGRCYLTNDGEKENTQCSENLDKVKKYNKKFIEKYGQLYLHIFETDSQGNYHWISSSQFKEK